MTQLQEITTHCADIAAIYGTSARGLARHQAGRFIEALTGSDQTPMTFQTYDPCGQQKDLDRVRHGRLDQVFEELFSLNALGAAIGVTINETDFKGRSNSNVVRVRAVFADEDITTHITPPIEPDIIVHGRDKRRHFYWFVDDLPVGEFSLFQKAIAAYMGSDPAICDPVRAMRLPGFRHWSDGSDVVPLVEVVNEHLDALVLELEDELPYEWSEPPRRTASELRLAFRVSGPPVVAHEPSSDEESLPDLEVRVTRAKSYLSATPGAVEGEGGDNDTFALACKLVRGFGLPVNDAFDLMVEWNRKCVPPWNDEDLRRKLNRAESGGTEPLGGLLSEIPPPPTLQKIQTPDSSVEQGCNTAWICAGDFLAEPEEKTPAYLGDAVLQKGGTCMVVGPSQVRKTWLILQMAVALASGRDFLGHTVPAPVRVLLLESESSRTYLRRRLRSVISGMGMATPENLILLNRDAALPQIGTELETVVRSCRAEVVILDTQGFFWVGDENSNSDWKQKVFGPLKKISRSCDWQPSFILVHHLGGNGERSRGATAIENDADTVLYLDKKKENPVLRFKKVREACEPIPDIPLTFDNDKRVLVVVAPDADNDTKDAVGDKEQQMYNWVAAYARDNGRLRPKDVTPLIMKAFDVSNEVARKVPSQAAGRGFLKRIQRGVFGPVNG